MTLFVLPYDTILDANGDPINGAKVNFYEAGTSTPLDTFSDEDLSSANANPVVADSSGRVGPIYLKPQPYKVVTTDASDNIIDTTDNYRAHTPNGEQILYAATVGGTANAITLTLDPAILSLREGTRIWFKVASDNTGAATINLNAIGATAVVAQDGAALIAGMLQADGMAEVIVSGSTFVLSNPAVFIADSVPPSALSPLASLALNGQCRLTLDTGNLKLSPQDGSYLFINGEAQQIPSAGVTLAATGLPIDTDHYIYAFMSGSTMTLEASTTGYATDSTYGHQIKSGDVTRSLVGLARTVTGPAWADSAVQRFVLSWFSRRHRALQRDLVSSRTQTSSTLAEMSAADRVELLVWAGENIPVQASVAVSNTNVAAICTTRIAVDGVAVEGALARHTQRTANDEAAHTCVASASMTEGYHFLNILTAASAGTSTYSTPGGISSMVVG